MILMKKKFMSSIRLKILSLQPSNRYFLNKYHFQTKYENISSSKKKNEIIGMFWFRDIFFLLDFFFLLGDWIVVKRHKIIEWNEVPFRILCEQWSHILIFVDVILLSTCDTCEVIKQYYSLS